MSWMVSEDVLGVACIADSCILFSHSLVQLVNSRPCFPFSVFQLLRHDEQQGLCTNTHIPGCGMEKLGCALATVILGSSLEIQTSLHIQALQEFEAGCLSLRASILWIPQ